MPLTQELHVIRAHHLHYASLLDDFAKAVHFVEDTHNPAMGSYSSDVRESSKMVMKRECSNLLSEIKRLDMELKMQDRRLKNVMNLVSRFGLVVKILTLDLGTSDRCLVVLISPTVDICAR